MRFEVYTTMEIFDCDLQGSLGSRYFGKVDNHVCEYAISEPIRHSTNRGVFPKAWQEFYFMFHSITQQNYVWVYCTHFITYALSECSFIEFMLIFHTFTE